MYKDESGIVNGVTAKERFVNRILLLIILLIMIIIPGIRSYVGTDYYNYYEIFEKDMQLGVQAVTVRNNGIFWSIPSLLSVITDEVYWVYIVIATLIALFIVTAIKNNSINFALSLFVYFASFDYFNSFNGMRMCIAAGIVFYGTKFIRERQMWRYFLCVGLAIWFHYVAIVALPFYFILQWDVRGKRTLLLFVMTILATMGLPLIIRILQVILAGTHYEQYAANFVFGDGVNPLRIVIAAIPVVLSYKYYDSLYNSEDEKRWINILINCSIMNLLLVVLGLINVQFVRFASFFSLNNTLLIPYITRGFDNKTRKVTTVLLCCVYLIYLIGLLPRDSGLLPYRTIFDYPA